MDLAANNVLYERLAWRKKVQGPELIRTIVNLWYHFSKNVPECKLAIEEVAAQKVLRQSINEIDPYIPVTVVRPDKDKARRLIDVSRYFEYGSVSLKTQGLVDEVIAFPHGDCDRTDALIYCLRLFSLDYTQSKQPAPEQIDNLLNIGQNELELYLERSEAGIPNHSVPEKIRREAQMSEYISMMMDGVL